MQSNQLFATALFAAYFASTMQAGTIALTGFDPTRSGTATYRTANTPGGSSFTTYTETVGAMLVNYNGIGVSPVFCVDWYTSIGFSTYASTPGIAQSAREGRVAWLYVNLIATVTTAVQGEAFQLAIWDIIHDGGDGLSRGSIRSSTSTTTAVRSAWASYLDASLGQSLLTGNYFYRNVSLADGSPRQNLIGQAWVTEVPEPATYALMAVGLGLVLFGRHGRRNSESHTR